MESAYPGVGVILAVCVLVGVGIAGVLWKPAVALMIAGVSIVGGTLAMGAGGLLGPSAGINAVIGGIVLIGLGRMIEIAEDAQAQLRGLRGDLKEARPARKADPAG